MARSSRVLPAYAPPMPVATIVGAGVSGLTTAVRLLEEGWDVRVVAREQWESTVSRIAAAVWTTTEAEPRQLARGWALESRERFEVLAEQHPNSGVVPLRQREFERIDPGKTWWDPMPFVRRLPPKELPAGYAAGWEIDGFMIEPPLYLPWLADHVRSMDGTLSPGAIDRLEDVAGDLVVNCTGLSARELVADDTMYPIRGQVVAVTNPGIRDAVADESDIDRVTYVYPRSEEVILGGTRQSGAVDSRPDPATTERILADAALLDPRVGSVEMLEERVGFRPGRPRVRVERGALGDGRPVVHNYGHGGAGYILSWGCASRVVALASD